jgi:hypothetical protein
MPAALCDHCGQPGTRLSTGAVLCRACYEAAMWEVASWQASKHEADTHWPGWRL